MQKNLRILLFTLLIIMFPALSKCQVGDSLSVNSEVFIEQISEILQNTPSKTMQEKSQKLMNRFLPVWSAGRFNKDEKDVIREVVEKMRSKKMRTYPQLYEYMYSLVLLSESKQLPKSIIAWHAYVLQLLENTNAKSFDDFMDYSAALLQNDVLFKKKSLLWFHRNSKFSFFLDTSLLIKFTKIELVGATRKDSSVIKNTAGVLNYETLKWYGKSGKCDWTRFGDNFADQVFVEFGNYNIDFKQSDFTIDSAVLIDKRFFKQKVLGQFKDRVLSNRSNNKTSYPRFKAYLEDYEVNDIYPNINFKGGFEHKGLKLYGIENEYEKARLELIFEDSIIGRIYSDAFRFDDDKIESRRAEISFYFEKDSLYHPDLHVKYDASNQQMVLYNENEGSNMIPFFDSYHQLDIYVQALYWKMNETKMFFKKIRAVNNENKASFISSNYYSERDFYLLQGIDEINPMYVIENYSKTYNVDEIQLNSLADFMKKPPEQVSAMLIRLSNKGYLVYDTKEETAKVKDRLKYFLKAKSGQTDYDVIRLESNVTAKPNASINIKTLDLDVYGVPFVQISDSQEVYIFPYDKTISFKENRNFNFDGYVRLGLLDFYSRSTTFVYDSFMFNMNFVDSLAFWVNMPDSINRIDSLVRVKNVITDLNGKLYIDEPRNKSGLKHFAEYPIFNSEEESYVYYNKSFIQDSTLVPERFYYTVDPFIFDSISTFSTDGLAFSGTLTSADIFDPIIEPLVVTPDHSLGFSHSTNKDGYGIYNNKGTFYSKISLDNNGFKGHGRLDYLTAAVESGDFVFYPDSLTTIGINFESLADQNKYNYPAVQGDTVDIFWEVDTNLMTVNTIAKPFILYNNSSFKGTLKICPDFMKGEGEFYFDQSEVISREMDFMYNKLTADSAIFNMRDVEGKDLIFKSSGYFATIDFENQQGLFKNLYQNSFIEFPFNKYISTLDEMEWDMYNDRLNLSGNLNKNHQALDTLNDLSLIDYALEGPEFISINPEHDSLRFFAGKADYNLHNYTINIEDVRMLKVADAAIFPEGKSLTIVRDGHIPTLKNARIIADTVNKYHHFYDAEVNVFSKHNYSASGYIDYVDRNDVHQAVYLNSIGVNNGITTGLGSLPPGDIFFLSPEYFFTGDIYVGSDNKNFRFTGGYQINQECISLEGSWINFDNYIDANNIYFDLKRNSLGADSTRTIFGMAYSSQFGNFYPRVFQELQSSNDFVVVDAVGRMDYDSISSSYRVGSVERLNNDFLDDNLVELETKRCVLKSDGIINLGLNEKMFTTRTAGQMVHKIIPDSTYLNTSLLLDFFFDKKALEMMTDSLRLSSNTPVSPAEGMFPLFLKKIVGTENSALMLTELALYGQIKKLPDVLKHTLLFTDLHMRWDKKSKSFVSIGKIGIGSINEQPINKYVDGYIQIEKGRSGSGINIFLRPSKEQWYFFTYKFGILQVLSSDNSFNMYVEGLKPEKRMLNPDSDEDYFEFVISTKRKSIEFLREMEQINKIR
jgi:hypothetical protein